MIETKNFAYKHLNDRLLDFIFKCILCKLVCYRPQQMNLQLLAFGTAEMKKKT